MMDHTEHEAAFNKGMSDRGDNHKIEYNSGLDKSINPSVPDRLDFSQNDGDSPGKHLSLQTKSASDNDRTMSTNRGMYSSPQANNKNYSRDS